MPDVGRFFNIDPLAEKFTYNSPYAFAENRVIDGRELEGLEWVSSRNLENKTVNWHLTYRPVNNSAGALSKEQMSALTRDREAQIISSYSGKSSDGNQVNISFNQSEKATILWEYNMAYDFSKAEGSDTTPKNEKDRLAATLDGFTDKLGDTQNNRSQINVAITEGIVWTSDGNIDWDKSNRANVARTGAHETGHELGLDHYDTETLKNPQNLLQKFPKGTQISPAQRTQITNLMEQQQKQNK